MKKFSKKLVIWLHAMRLLHWYKGFWVILALYGQPQITFRDLYLIGLALVVVSLLSGAIYINNDIHDIDSDRKHPTKKYRPFAAGELTENEGRVGLMVLAIFIGGLLLVINNVAVTNLAFLMAIGNLIYTQKIKEVPYLELFYYGFLSAIRYWIGIAVIGANFILLPNLFAVSVGLCMLTLLRYMEKSRYGNAGRNLLKGYSMIGLKTVMIISGMVCAISNIMYASTVALWLVIPSAGLSLYYARLLYLGMQKVKDPEKVDDLDKMLRRDLWLKLLVIPYAVSIVISIVASISW